MRRLLLVAAALSVAACAYSPAAPTPVDVPFSITELVAGTGTIAAKGQTVTVNYTGWLYDASKTDNKGTQFDTTTGRGPLSFVLGSGQVIGGWDLGIPGMKVGGTRRLVIPPSFGYGSFVHASIPASSTLVFDIELLTVQ